MRSHHSQVPAVGIYCYSLELGATPISDYYYWEAYQDLVLSLRATGVEVYFVTPASPYLGRGRFAYGYTLDQKLSDPAHMRRVNDIRVNIILERSEPQPFEGTDVPLLNSAEIRSMINDKISLWEHFGEFQAESRIVYDVRQLLATVRLMPGNKVVVKVPNGFGGTGVYIGKKSDVLRQVPRDQFPLLVQEFLDTSMGAPGHEPAVHDVRIKVCGGEIIGYAMRIAKPGSYHSNLSMGGTQLFLPVEEIPAELVETVRKIDVRFHGQPRLYSADFAFSHKGWKMIELNDYVGLTATLDGPVAIDSVNRIATYIAAVASAPVQATPVG
jgi:glutathione synthase/RimK-type ligase-like ATP-grasp enzyme